LKLSQQIKKRLTMAGHTGIEDQDSDSSPEKIYRITDGDEEARRKTRSKPKYLSKLFRKPNESQEEQGKTCQQGFLHLEQQ
jgi:hypothetical protein